MRILLINAPHPAIGSRVPHEHLPPLGLLAIGGPLIDAGHDVRLLDAEFGADGHRGDAHGDWYFDVDSGPVIAGHGTAACAYGIGAARTNGRFDQAWPLSAEALAMSWPLPSGTLAGARILSNATDAPYLGEAGMIFIFTRQPLPGFAEVKGGRLTGYVYVILCAYLAVAAFLVTSAWRSVRRWRRNADRAVTLEKCRFIAWAMLMLGAAGIFLVGPWPPALASLLLAQFLTPAEMKWAAETATRS